MIKLPKPPKNLNEEPQATGDGYYWLYDHRRDTVYPMLYQRSVWQDVQYEGMAGKEIIEGPLPFPTEEQVAGHLAHFHAFRMEEWARIGFDPVWDLGDPKTLIDPSEPTLPPDPMMDGWFWVQFVDQEFPEIAQAHEGTWCAMELNGPTWEHDDLDLYPKTLFGPLILPAKETVKSRVPAFAALARSHLPHGL